MASRLATCAIDVLTRAIQSGMAICVNARLASPKLVESVFLIQRVKVQMTLIPVLWGAISILITGSVLLVQTVAWVALIAILVCSVGLSLTLILITICALRSVVMGRSSSSSVMMEIVPTMMDVRGIATSNKDIRALVAHLIHLITASSSNQVKSPSA